MRVRLPPPAPDTICGGSSTVESEHARLGMGVRFSSIAPRLSRISGRTAVCNTEVPSSILGRLSTALGARWTGGCLLNSMERVRIPPRALSPSISCPHHARWIRQPDPHSGNAGSNPAGDAGPSCLPVCHFGGPRPGGRAHQSPCPGGQAPGYELGCRGSTPRRETTASVLAEPGPSLRSLYAGFDSRQGRKDCYGVSAGTHVGL